MNNPITQRRKKKRVRKLYRYYPVRRVLSVYGGKYSNFFFFFNTTQVNLCVLELQLLSRCRLLSISKKTCFNHMKSKRNIIRIGHPTTFLLTIPSIFIFYFYSFFSLPFPFSPKNRRHCPLFLDGFRRTRRTTSREKVAFVSSPPNFLSLFILFPVFFFFLR